MDWTQVSQYQYPNNTSNSCTTGVQQTTDRCLEENRSTISETCEIPFHHGGFVHCVIDSTAVPYDGSSRVEAKISLLATARTCNQDPEKVESWVTDEVLNHEKVTG